MRVTWKKNPNDLSGKFEGLEEEIQDSVGQEWVRLGWCDPVRTTRQATPKPEASSATEPASGDQDQDTKGLEGPLADKAIRSPVESKGGKKRSR